MDTAPAPHTPGPWHVAAYESTPAFRAIDLHEAICKDDGPYQGQGDLLAVVGPLNDPQSIADAERIVACVNAMTGIADPRDFVSRAKLALAAATGREA